MKRFPIYNCLILFVTLFSSCSAFMHGLTEDKALNSYTIVKGDDKSFGDKRLKYNAGFHNNSALSAFLKSRTHPSFIYEYKTKAKCRGIQLFYTAQDSVFIFEEPKRGNLRSIFKEARKMDEYERQSYQRLLANK